MQPESIARPGRRSEHGWQVTSSATAFPVMGDSWLEICQTGESEMSSLEEKDKKRMKRAARILYGIFAIIFGVVVVLVLFSFAGTEHGPRVLFVGALVAIAALLIGLGLNANYKWFGATIDSLNRSSLSRVQIVIWTLLVLSAYLAIALPRSIPGALKEATDQQVKKCVREHRDEKIAALSGVESFEVLEIEDAEQAAEIQQSAEEECALLAEEPQPLNIVFPPELVAALGISAASFAGSTLVKSSKKNRQVTLRKTEQQVAVKSAENIIQEKQEGVNSIQEVIAEIEEWLELDANKDSGERPAKEQKLGENRLLLEAAQGELVDAEKELSKAEEGAQVEDVQRVGLLKTNPNPWDAELGDVFRGDEVGNYNLIDMSKVQMAFFTVVVVFAYSVAVWTLLGDRTVLFDPFGVELPAFSASLTAILLISHAGYLAVKTPDHTKVE